MRGSLRTFAVGVLFLTSLVVAVRFPQASSTGISGFSGAPMTDELTCNECHSGGVPPTVTIAGPSLVTPGSTHSFTLTISGGQQRGGGLDVAADGGTLVATDLVGTRVQFGEIVHNSTRNVDVNRQVIWSFDWIAPPTEGTVTLFGAGNSVNLSQGANGDRAGLATLEITVSSGSGLTPGETSGATLNPLLVTGYDRVSGEITLSYEASCESTGHNLYFGPLEDVAVYGWSGEACDVGTSGTVSGFAPGPGSVYFVIVGHKGANEGSYGLDDLPDGTRNERPPFAGNLCGKMQALGDRCDGAP